MPEQETGRLTEERIREILEEYRAAYERRDRAALLDFFADDAVMTLAPGVFGGREGVAAVFDWDLRDTSSVRIRPLGVGLLVKGNVAVREVVFEATWKGLRYEYPNLAVFEFDDDGKIHAYRSYYDKLGIDQRIAGQYPGVQGRLFRLLVNYLVAQGEKGLHRPGEARRQAQSKWRCVPAGIVGAGVAGLVVALAARVVPRMASRAASGMMQGLTERMCESGCDPPEF